MFLEVAAITFVVLAFYKGVTHLEESDPGCGNTISTQIKQFLRFPWQKRYIITSAGNYFLGHTI